ncbi:MAG: porin [Sulfurovum sp.]|nr:porin [Sulfurovum sp.]
MKTNTFTKLSSGVALSLVTSTILHATNGDTLIAVGTKARGMGGVGIGMSHGAESTLSNPAMITTVEGTEISFGGTIFMPDITSQITTAGGPDQSYSSDADINMIPEVSLAHKLTENWYIGIGMWGTAGMGVDYSKFATPGSLNNFQMVTNLQLMQFAVPIAYKIDGLSIAFSPIMQYGNLDINYNYGGTVGAGLAQDFGFGYTFGASYNFNNGLTLGAVYKSSIEMDYTNQLTTATAPFGISLPDNDTLEQPAEYGIGLSYVMGQHTFAFDYKRIKWSSAKGYQDFGWDDQDVYALGYQYTQDNWALRLGYNHASSAVVEAANGATSPTAAALNMFNLLGFPATAEDHYTVGGTYEFSKQFSLDLAYVYSPSTSETYDIAALFGPNANISTDHKESSLSFQLTYKF